MIELLLNPITYSTQAPHLFTTPNNKNISPFQFTIFSTFYSPILLSSLIVSLAVYVLSVCTSLCSIKLNDPIIMRPSYEAFFYMLEFFYILLVAKHGGWCCCYFYEKLFFSSTMKTLYLCKVITKVVRTRLVIRDKGIKVCSLFI